MPEHLTRALYRGETLRQIEAVYSDLPLMQRAGAAAASWAVRLVKEERGSILVLVGPGNNGGDAVVVADLLRQQGFIVDALYVGDSSRLSADAEKAHQSFLANGGCFLDHISDTQKQKMPWGLVIDGLFGIGLKNSDTTQPQPCKEPYATWIDLANHLHLERNIPLLSLDCPSGLDSDHGAILLEPAIKASHTLTFMAQKPGLHTLDGPDHCGMVQLADLEIDCAAVSAADAYLLGWDALRHAVPVRHRNTHKGDFGRVGVIGGSEGMIGAPLLAARAALKAGAGSVYVASPAVSFPVCDIQQPELMLCTIDSLLKRQLDVLLVGPGLDEGEDTKKLLEQLCKLETVLVLDAGALNVLAAGTQKSAQKWTERKAPLLMTPHPKEAARLLNCSVKEVQQNRIESALQIAQMYHAYVALKGCGTLVVTPDSAGCYINPTGNPGLASAGMGDVLAGICTALLAQGIVAERALPLAVYVHGAAADQLVAQGVGPIGLTAGEIINVARQILNSA